MPLMSKAFPNTKTNRLYLLLKKKIEDGVYAAGTQLPSCRRLSEEFDVSYVTACLALKTLVDQGLARNRRGRGIFVPDYTTEMPAARQVKLICTSFDTPSAAAFRKEGMEVFEKAGWQVRPLEIRDREAVGDEIGDFSSFVILYGFGFACYRKIVAEIERIRAQQRVVVIGERCERHGIASVIADEPQQIRLAMELLRRSGRRRVGLLCGNLGNSVEQERVAAWRNFHRSADGETVWQRYFFEMGITDADGDDRIFTAEYLKRTHADGRLKAIDALIVPDPPLARVTAGFFRDHNIRIPEDIALVSIGDADFLSFLSPRITVVDPDMRAHIQAALEFLEERHNRHNRLPLLHLCEPYLKIRESVPAEPQ